LIVTHTFFKADSATWPFNICHSMDPGQRLILLAVEAQKRFERVSDENRQLKLQLDSQKIVISDLSQSLGDTEKIEKDLQAINEQLATVEQRLSDASTLLLDQLSDSVRQAGPANVGEVLKLLITQIALRVTELANEGISKGSMALSVLQIVEFEDNIRKIIEDLREKKMYPESPEEEELRVVAVQKHTAGLLKFLQDFVETQGSES
jgi:predicted O-linked N-acetylglucosamine transferase (SPINDLY family)